LTALVSGAPTHAASHVATTPAPITQTIGAPKVMPVLERRLSQGRRRRARFALIDTAIIASAAALTTVLHAVAPATELDRMSVTAAAVIVAAWAATLIVLSDHAHRRGAGERFELAPILHSTMVGVAAIATLSVVTGWPVLGPHLLLTVPLGAATLVAVRATRRTFARRRPPHRTMGPRTIVVGSRSSVEYALTSLLADSRLIHNVLGVALLGDEGTSVEVAGRTFATLGRPEEVARLAKELCIETVIVADGVHDADYLRRLSWSLEGAATDLILATRLTDVDRSRIAFDRTHGLALTHVSLPRFDRSTLRAKRALDVVVATLALVPIALITPLIALLIVLDSPGGVFFRQRRIGRDGQVFEILKFRTMGVDAEARKAELAASNEGSGPLFKLRNDPRVTRVGAVLRKFSLDELPQFWNVLVGDMSVVGPRPPLPSEVADYDHQVLRRLYVQPGITGLWQVSGRSDLSWEQSVRLDLNYVENWSLLADVKIILRTAAVMVRPSGAY